MNKNLISKLALVFVILIELIVGLIFLLNFYQQKIVYKTQDSDKAAVIKKENLIFPEDSEFKYYYELQPNTKYTDEPGWLDYKVTYIHNADGLNERFDYTVEKPENTFRIITLGDSFTFGQFVNTKDNWPEQLEDMLNQNLTTDEIKKFEVINLGMSGFDVPYLIKRYKDIGAKYNPDLIIWFESGSGFTRSNEIEGPIFDNYVAELKKNNIDMDSKEIHAYTDEEVIRLFLSDSGYKINSEIIEKLNIFLQNIEQNKIIFFSFVQHNLYHLFL